MCQRLCPVCLPPEPHQAGVSTTTTTFLWNGPIEVSPTGGYRPAPCRSGGYITRAEEEDVD